MAASVTNVHCGACQGGGQKVAEWEIVASNRLLTWFSRKTFTVSIIYRVRTRLHCLWGIKFVVKFTVLHKTRRNVDLSELATVCTTGDQSSVLIACCMLCYWSNSGLLQPKRWSGFLGLRIIKQADGREMSFGAWLVPLQSQPHFHSFFFILVVYLHSLRNCITCEFAHRSMVNKVDGAERTFIFTAFTSHPALPAFRSPPLALDKFDKRRLTSLWINIRSYMWI